MLDANRKLLWLWFFSHLPHEHMNLAKKNCACKPCKSSHTKINLSSRRMEEGEGWLGIRLFGPVVKSVTLVKEGLNQQCPLFYIGLANLPHTQHLHYRLNAPHMEWNYHLNRKTLICFTKATSP